MTVAIVIAALLGAALVAWLLLRPRQPAVATARIDTPDEHTTMDANGSVRSVQAADLIMPAEELDAIWTPHHLERQLTVDDLVASDDCFFSATGVTDGDVLEGVHYQGAAASTDSLVMRSRSGTVRRVQARHDRAKLRALSSERMG